MPNQQPPHGDALIIHLQVSYLIQHLYDNSGDDIGIVVHGRKLLSQFIVQIFDVRQINIHQTPDLLERIH